MDREERIERLNRLGERYCAARRDGRKCDGLTESVFLELYALFSDADKTRAEPKLADAIGEFFLRDWPSFDADKGTLYAFAQSRLKFQTLNMSYKDSGAYKRKVGKGERDEGETREYRRETPKSLDDPASNPVESDAANDTEGELLFDATALDYLTLNLQLRQRLRGKARNEQRLTYYRMFFTDAVTDILRNMEVPESYIRHERDLFAALKRGFLNFYMRRPCESVRDIRETPMKLHGEVVNGSSMEPMGHPLPNDVYLTYLNDKEGFQIRSAGTISNQRKEYRQFLRENLC